MANRDLLVIEGGRRKRRPSQDMTVDFSSVRIGESQLPIAEVDGKLDFNNTVLTNIGEAVENGDLASFGQVKQFVSTAVVTGGVVKQQLLTQQQLDNTLGIIPGTVFFLSENPSVNDVFTLKDEDANTESWTFVAERTTDNEVTIGGTAAESMENLAAAVMADSDYWKAYYEGQALADLYPGGLVGVYRKAIKDFYLYVVQDGEGTIEGFVADFSGEKQYKTDPTVIAIPSSDPGAATVYSGFKATKGTLQNGEIHNVLAEDRLYSWNADFNEGEGEWFIMSEGALPLATAGSGGGILGKVSADSDKGLAITTGVLAVKVDNSTVGFNESGQLEVPEDGIDSLQLADGAVTSDKIGAQAVGAAALGADVAGDGLSGGSGAAIDVNVGDALKIDGSNNVAVDFTMTKTNDNAGAITARQIVYVKSNGNVDLAKADVANLDHHELGIVADASIASTESGKIVFRRGAVIGGFSDLTPGQHLYVSRATAGAYQQNLAEFEEEEFVYSVGRALSATELLFNPEFMFEY